MTQRIEKLDSNFAPAPAPGPGGVEGDRVWYDIRDLGVEGRAFADTLDYYDRLPARAKGVVREAVWHLSRHSAGMRVRFVTDATRIAARWTLRFEQLALPHMAATGVSGLDLHLKHEGAWHWVGAGRPETFPDNEVALVSEELAPGRREYELSLPLYNGVARVEIGLPRGAALDRAPAYAAARSKPLCFYGTSIVQGACAARPGMCHTAILARRLDWPHLNLGFSGNGRLEPEVADLLAQVDPAAYILDAVPNNQPDDVRARLGPFVRRLRREHPYTPILLVESILYQQGIFVPAHRQRCNQNNLALRQVHGQLRDEGCPALHLVPGEHLLGDDGQGTVDGAHPSDLGFIRIADVLEPPLRAALAASVTA
ncbi:MAG: SGNH/GDSL hydrolase family protein [Phycisphaeraceae bacterium]